MPYSILKLDIIMSRWDEKDPLIGTWHDPEQKVNMGKRGSVSVFSTECCRSMLASNVTGWPVSSWVPWQWWQESCVEHTEKEESGRGDPFKQDEETASLPRTTTRRAYFSSDLGKNPGLRSHRHRNSHYLFGHLPTATHSNYLTVDRNIQEL